MAMQLRRQTLILKVEGQNDLELAFDKVWSISTLYHVYITTSSLSSRSCTTYHAYNMY